MPVRFRLFPVLALLFVLATPLLAQEDEEGRFSVGLGGGLVDTGSSSDPYYTANLRTRIGYRVAGEERQGSVFGYFEPEVGYWKRDNNGASSKDTLVGVNIGGAVRLRVFEYFVGGGVGYHFFDQRTPRIGGGSVSTSDGKVGVNAQFGFDVRVSEMLSLFGVGRFDLIQDTPQTRETKVYLGLRVHL
ncbi:MAG TPA: hypothetical protein VGV61_01095 [Thermoanaerobaculia bacterium]|jgi:hypothetical protein|nr:hypothetical protein [Thermoanaerobaculia bacterium]